MGHLIINVQLVIAICVEIRAKKLGANTIRLDTFDFQGKDFYKSMGYEQVGYYRNDEDNFEEYFFLKKILSSKY